MFIATLNVIVLTGAIGRIRDAARVDAAQLKCIKLEPEAVLLPVVILNLNQGV